MKLACRGRKTTGALKRRPRQKHLPGYVVATRALESSQTSLKRATAARAHSCLAASAFTLAPLAECFSKNDYAGLEREGQAVLFSVHDNQSYLIHELLSFAVIVYTWEEFLLFFTGR